MARLAAMLDFVARRAPRLALLAVLGAGLGTVLGWGGCTGGPRFTDGAGTSDTASGPDRCGSDSATALAGCVDAEAIERDVAFIAAERPPGSPHWQAVQDLCAARLVELGFTVERLEYGTGVDMVGRLRGADAPEQVVLVGAHYDHVAGCPGADDNATGVAGVLELARVLAGASSRSRTLAIACWDEEERGLLGSTAWVTRGQVPGETVVAYFNYDMIGVASDAPDSQAIPAGFDGLFPEQYQQVASNDFRGDFILAVADDLAAGPLAAFELHAGAGGLPTLTATLDAQAKVSPLLLDLRRSDHAPFWLADIPAVFVTDTGELRNPAYHCVGGVDSVASLDLGFARDVVAATVGAVAEQLGVPR